MFETYMPWNQFHQSLLEPYVPKLFSQNPTLWLNRGNWNNFISGTRKLTSTFYVHRSKHKPQTLNYFIHYYLNSNHAYSAQESLYGFKQNFQKSNSKRPSLTLLLHWNNTLLYILIITITSWQNNHCDFTVQSTICPLYNIKLYSGHSNKLVKRIILKTHAYWNCRKLFRSFETKRPNKCLSLSWQ